MGSLPEAALDQILGRRGCQRAVHRTAPHVTAHARVELSIQPCAHLVLAASGQYRIVEAALGQLQLCDPVEDAAAVLRGHPLSVAAGAEGGEPPPERQPLHRTKLTRMGGDQAAIAAPLSSRAGRK